MVSPINNSGVSGVSSLDEEDQGENDELSIDTTIRQPSQRERASRFVVGSYQPVVIGAYPVGFINQNNLTIEETRAQAVQLSQIIGGAVNLDVVYQPGGGGDWGVISST
ncbi:MAG: hypothetical protein RR302_01115 [Victivallaceae bacterium]